jgi:quercetin dioxygenase-like cupin family protein
MKHDSNLKDTYTPTKEQVESRIARFKDLKPFSVATELDWVPQEAMDIVYARTILPMVLADSKNPFGKTAPVKEADGLTMYISVLPPGQGPCAHSHNNTFETFMVLEGEIEYSVGDPVEHTVKLGKYDVFSCPPLIHRSFKNVGSGTALQLTVITGERPGNLDEVQMPNSVAEQVGRDHGEKVLAAFNDLFTFEPKA